jgi:hypothetical protein
MQDAARRAFGGALDRRAERPQREQRRQQPAHQIHRRDGQRDRGAAGELDDCARLAALHLGEAGKP